MRIGLGISKHRLEFFDECPVLEGKIEFGSVVGNTEFGVFYLPRGELRNSFNFIYKMHFPEGVSSFSGFWTLEGRGFRFFENLVSRRG